MRRLLFCLALLFLASCVVPQRPISTVGPPAAEYLCWSQTLSGFEQEWSAEAERQLHIRPIIVVCHGGEINHEWWMFPDPPLHPARVADVAQTMHALYPGRYILLICCDTGQYPLFTPGVFYCRKYTGVWNVPGANLGIDINTLSFGCYGGFITDFEEGKP